MNPTFGNIMDLAGRPKVVPSAASILLNRDQNKISITGTTTITSIIQQGPPADNEGRLLLIWGASGAAFTLTHTASPGLGQMQLGGSDVGIFEDDCVLLEGLSNGGWRRVQP